jgi:hypothetical protein
VVEQVAVVMMSAGMVVAVVRADSVQQLQQQAVVEL